MRFPNDIRIESWNDLQEALFRGSWNENLRRFRSPFAYRGLSDAKYSLETTLMRLGGDHVFLEPHLLRNFRKYAHRDNVERDSLWHWLAVAQHHGLPTRLLDWTYSPLIALHFATANTLRFDTDGVIWAVDYEEIRSHLPEPIAQRVRGVGSHVFTVEMLAEHVESFATLEAQSDEAFPLFFEPPSIDDRIVNQFAFFSLMSTPTALMDEWLETRPELWFRIVIPARLKWEIRDKLDQANITERVLFPGLDGLSTFLRRHYSPGP